MATYTGSETHHWYKAYEIVTTSSTDTQTTVTVKAGGICTGSTTDTIGTFTMTVSATNKSNYVVGPAKKTLTHGNVQTQLGSTTFTYTRGTSAATKTIKNALYLNLSNGNGGPCTSTASGTVTISAKPKYTVTYNANGGSSTKTSESVYSGSTGTFPTASQCTRTNYTLLGWATSSSATSASYSPGASTPTITAAKTYYAVWKINPKATITINANGGTISDSPHHYSSGSTDYYFKLTSAGVVQSSSSASGTYSNFTQTVYTNDTYKDLYNVATFGITKDGHYITGTSAFGSTTSGGTLFSQQNTSSDSTHPVTTKRLNGNTEITSNISVTLYVHWIPNTWIIHFDGNGATSGSMSDQTHTYGTALALPPNAFTRTGYRFVGWNREADGSGASYPNQYAMGATWAGQSTTGVTYTFYAQWEPAGLWVGVSNEWKSVKNIYVRTDNAWKPVNNIKIYLSDGWKHIYGAEAVTTCTHTNAQTVKLSYCIGEHEFDCCVSEGEYQNWTICPDCGMVYVSATGNPDEYISCDICDTESSWNGYRDTWLPASTFPGITDRTEYTNIYHL